MESESTAAPGTGPREHLAERVRPLTVNERRATRDDLPPAEFAKVGLEFAHRAPWYRPTRPVPAVIPRGFDAITAACWFGLERNALAWDVFLRVVRLGRKPGEPPRKEWTKIAETARRALEFEDENPDAAADVEVDYVAGEPFDPFAVRASFRPALDPSPSVEDVIAADARRAPPPPAELSGDAPAAPPLDFAGRRRELGEARESLIAAAIGAADAWTRVEIAWADAANPRLGESSAPMPVLLHDLAARERERDAARERYRAAAEAAVENAPGASP
jgi:hypothetical protein